LRATTGPGGAAYFAARLVSVHEQPWRERPLLYTRVGKIANNRPASPFLNYRKLERIFDESGEDGID
jgi:hypothetical protein